MEWSVAHPLPRLTAVIVLSDRTPSLTIAVRKGKAVSRLNFLKDPLSSRAGEYAITLLKLNGRE
ncbi:MAG: hypothetical protein U1D30_13635 [Planctomycetota bacterium]